ncbi:MAG: imidazole glycerol phosphate synthase subunit HisH [Candidatus Omnitrophica bacterium]|nr:imidazole glycerol phosphate synthase subunit HisH [Candidatus Omnitrophota bacterium]
MIAIVDYGMGNLKSVANAFEAIGSPARLVTRPEELREAAAIVVPGVGAFGDGMRNLRARGFVEALEEEVRRKGKPYLGICLGMQFLADVSFEHGEHAGLGWIRGAVKRLEPDDRRFKVPHMGWNDLRLIRDSALFADLPGEPVFYFVHSYHVEVAPEEAGAVTATCWHGADVTAAVQKEQIFGVQFHPEKSQQVGLHLLKNFVQSARLCMRTSSVE